MPKLYILSGPPGSGKSTWAKKHLISDKNKYVSRDEIRYSMMSEEELEGAYFSKEKEVYQEFIWNIYNYLKQGFNVVADATHLNEPSRTKLLSRIPESVLKDVPIAVIYFTTPLKICLDRNETRKGTKTYVPPDQLRRMFFSATQPTFEEGKQKIDEIVIVNENGKIVKGIKKV